MKSPLPLSFPSRKVCGVAASSLTFLAFTACSSGEPSKPGWYNAPVLREVFGDYERTERFFISDPEELAHLRERGEYLTLHVAACGTCHAAEPTKPAAAFTGGQRLLDSYGEVNAPNITPDAETGIGKWNTAEVMRAIRASIDADGRPLSLDVHHAFRWMSDQDAKAIAVFVLSRQAQKNEVERRHLGGFERNRLGIFPEHQDFAGYVPALKTPDSVEAEKTDTTAYDARWGKYLASNVAQCATCHTRDGGVLGSAVPFAGIASEAAPSSVWSLKTWKSVFNSWKSQNQDNSEALLSPEAQQELQVRDESKQAPTAEEIQELRSAGAFPILGPDIRGSSASGLREWSTEDISNYLTTGRVPSDERTRDPSLCPWNSYAGMSEVDKKSIAAFLKQL